MNLKLLSTPLDINSVDFRLQSVNKGGYATILAYKDARVDMNRLDEVVGRGFWKREHIVINGSMYCRVSIYNEELNQWISMEDVGTESFTEKEKGLASDAFKRACFNWGIGRELYDYPFISVKLNKNEYDISKDQRGNDKASANYNFKLKEWKWNAVFENERIIHLSAIDQNNNQRFVWCLNSPQLQEKIEDVEKIEIKQEPKVNKKTLEDKNIDNLVAWSVENGKTIKDLETSVEMTLVQKAELVQKLKEAYKLINLSPDLEQTKA